MKKITLLFGAALLAALSASAENDIVVKAGQNVKLLKNGFVESTTYDFEDGTFQGWSSIDADGDNIDWMTTTGWMFEYLGHNSKYCLMSQSFDNSFGALTPNNYLVSPEKFKVTETSYISFYASAYNENHSAEHFGVAISTGDDRMNTDNYTTIAQWTYGEAVGASQAKAKGSAVRRDRTEYVQYQVDLSEYAGKEIWVAIRHFDCTNQFILNIDDITIGDHSTSCDWICDNPAIGMPASGSNQVEFVALNDASGKDIVANITVMPVDAEEYTFTVTVQPTNDEVLPVEDIKVEDGDKVEVNFEYMLTVVYDFEDGTFQGWSSIDADGDNIDWMTTTGWMFEYLGHNSKYCLMSQSFDNSFGALTPNNYLVSPEKFKVTETSYISFYASAYNENHSAEHFGVAISTGDDRMNTDNYTTIAQWTYGEAVGASQAKAKGSAVRRDRTEYVQYQVDLSEYAGKEIWVAIRHFDCTNQFILNIDDITIGDVYGLDSNCEWTNDNPAIGLAASGEGNISFDVVNNTDKEQVANITVNACKDVEGGKAYGAPMKFKVIVAPNESGIAEISVDADTDAVYYNISGIQIPADRLVPGIYLRRSAGKTDKVIVK